jgi:RES domain-containing protein
VDELAGFRLASWDTPLRANPNRNEGRWNRAGSGATQYISLHPLAPWAEYLRWHGIATWAQARELRLGMWAIRVMVEHMFDVTYENAATLGLDAHDLVADDWSPCQMAAERLRADRTAPKVLRTPSAALPGTKAIVILEPRVAIPYTLDPLDEIDLPVTLVAAGGRPPRSLLELVRHRGQPHEEFEAWQRGESFELAEPRDDLLAEDVRTP